MYKRGFRQASHSSKYGLSYQEFNNTCFTQLDAPSPPSAAHALLASLYLSQTALLVGNYFKLLAYEF